MPKTAIDFSKTVIYKLTAPDGSVHVGHTTNLVQRKSYLKSVMSIQSLTSDAEVQFVKKHGGIPTIHMEPVRQVAVANSVEAQIAVEETKKEFAPKSARPKVIKKIPVFKLIEPEPAPLMKIPVQPIVFHVPTEVPIRRMARLVKEKREKKAKESEPPAPAPEPLAPAPEPPAPAPEPPAPAPEPPAPALDPAPVKLKARRARKAPAPELLV
jgi:hypothetical protein